MRRVVSIGTRGREADGKGVKGVNATTVHDKYAAHVRVVEAALRKRAADRDVALPPSVWHQLAYGEARAALAACVQEARG